MTIKACFLSLLLALGLSNALAASRVATFKPVSPGSDHYVLDGFGRSVQSVAAAGSFSLLRQPLDLNGPAMPADGAAGFHDRYVLLGLPMGQYALSSLTPVTWGGGISVSAVSLSWLTASGDLPFIDFTVDTAAKQATGHGIFEVNCAATSNCVWLDVFGTETAGVAGQYGSPFAVAAVPEPASAAMLLAGMAALMLLARRRPG